MKTLMMAGAALVLAAMAGCSSSDKAGVRQNVAGIREQVGNAAEGARQAAADAALEGKVKSAISTRKGLDTRGLDVEATNGSITLKGTIASREQAEMAERVAVETDGVQSVDNQLMLTIPAKSTPYAAPAPPAAGSGY